MPLKALESKVAYSKWSTNGCFRTEKTGWSSL